MSAPAQEASGWLINSLRHYEKEERAKAKRSRGRAVRLGTHPQAADCLTLAALHDKAADVYATALTEAEGI